jgi:hypothetical protein
VIGRHIAQEVQLESAAVHVFPIKGCDSASRMDPFLLTAVAPFLIDAQTVCWVHGRHLGANREANFHVAGFHEHSDACVDNASVLEMGRRISVQAK